MNRVADHAAMDSPELQLARHLLARLALRGAGESEWVRSWIHASQRIGGDVVAVARTPTNELNVLVADPAGHGLVAVISALPLIDAFYSMCEKGFSLSSIVRELNRKAHFLLPTDRFLAATVLSVNHAERTVRVWNGGTPAACFITDSGIIERKWPAAHPALGVLDDADFDHSAHAYHWHEPGEVILMSDSLPLACNGSGEAFGLERIMAFLQEPASGRFDNLVERLQGHVGHTPQDDDLLAVRIRCDNEPLARRVPIAPHLESRVCLPNQTHWRLHMLLGATQLQQLDTMPLVMGWLEQVQVPAPHRGQVFLIIGELFNNALDHGLLQLESAMKQALTGFEDYLALREKRLRMLQDASIEIDLECFNIDCHQRLRIRVRDSGPGFNHTGVMAQRERDKDAFSGRGLMLVQRLCTSLTYSEHGNEATALYALD